MGRLTKANYKNEYPNAGSIVRYKRNYGKALVQADYGKDLDCTITSLAYVFGGAEKYDEVERIATQYGYNGDKTGTCPLVIKKIMKRMGAKNPKSAYGKGIGWSFETIVKIVDKGTPILLNMWDDGRHWYHDHTVTVIGYEEYKNARFLVVYDNWVAAPSMIDYDKLSIISSINW